MEKTTSKKAKPSDEVYISFGELTIYIPKGTYLDVPYSKEEILRKETSEFISIYEHLKQEFGKVQYGFSGIAPPPGSVIRSYKYVHALFDEHETKEQKKLRANPYKIGLIPPGVYVVGLFNKKNGILVLTNRRGVEFRIYIGTQTNSDGVATGIDWRAFKKWDRVKNPNGGEEKWT